MKRRMISLFLTTILTAALLSGCGGEQKDSSDLKESNTTEEDKKQETEPEEKSETVNDDNQEEKPEKLVMVISSEGTGPMEQTIKRFTEETGIEIELISEAYDNVHNKIIDYGCRRKSMRYCVSGYGMAGRICKIEFDTSDG